MLLPLILNILIEKRFEQWEQDWNYRMLLACCFSNTLGWISVFMWEISELSVPEVCSSSNQDKDFLKP